MMSIGKRALACAVLTILLDVASVVAENQQDLLPAPQVPLVQEGGQPPVGAPPFQLMQAPGFMPQPFMPQPLPAPALRQAGPAGQKAEPVEPSIVRSIQGGAPVFVPAEASQQPEPAGTSAEAQQSQSASPAGQPEQSRQQKLVTGTAVLNFSEANLKDILRTIAEITGENFIIAPGVSAKISVQTTKPVPKKDIFSIFESILEVNGLAAVKSGSYYKIVPAPSAKQRELGILNRPQLSDVPAGDAMMNVIIPVEFISANELMQIVKPMLSQAGNITLYSKSNTLILTDIASNIKKSLEIVAVFDVDAFQRMHIEMVPVRNVDIKTLNKELTDVFSALGFGKDTAQLSIVPIERLNSLVILSSGTELLTSVKDWIGRLDTITSGEGSSSINIYYVQNDKASTLKTILEQVFAGKKPQAPASGQPALAQATVPQPALREHGAASEEIKIFIYEPSNALIIQASQRDYQNILGTLRELDKVPKQVLIDALIVEVKLDESTKFGIQWSALTGNVNIQQNTGIFSTILNNPNGAISTPIGLNAPSGLTALATDSSRFFAVIQALASTGKINVLSNPHIVVKNYEKASINVGSDEPVATQSTQTAVTGTSGLIQNIEYRKTGVLLTVIPHITEGGMVAMTLRQEVSDKSTDRTVGDRTYPSFTKREAETSVVAKDRETLIIGGLIQERKDKTDSGIPFLSRIPLLGNLFKFSSVTNGKTELVILITPRVISDTKQAATATDEIKSKMQGLRMYFDK